MYFLFTTFVREDTDDVRLHPIRSLHCASVFVKKMTSSNRTFVNEWDWTKSLLPQRKRRADRNARECTRLVISTDARQQSGATVGSYRDVIWWANRILRCGVGALIGWRGVRCGVREIGRQRSLFKMETMCHTDYWRIILSFGELLRSRFTPPYPAGNAVTDTNNGKWGRNIIKDYGS